MKKVTAFVGSGRNKNTYTAVEQFLAKLHAFGDIESEIVVLSDYQLGFCRGCRVCFDRGEEFCPLKDDLGILVDKIKASDGVDLRHPELHVPYVRDHEDIPGQVRLPWPPAKFLWEVFYQHCHPGFRWRKQDH